VSKAQSGARRRELLKKLNLAGREMSDAVLMFHTALAEKLGLGPSDWKTLGLLERHGRLTAGELAEMSGLAKPSITGILDRLERSGWILRTRNPEDGRGVLVSLRNRTAGEQAATGLFQGLMQRMSDLYAQYSDEQLEMLLEFMTEIAERQKAATSELAQKKISPRRRAEPQAARRRPSPK
jgi:DNA-binding MarR family transcriptional regulator